MAEHSGNGNQHGWSKEYAETLSWYLGAAYVADSVGLLNPNKAAKLSSFEAEVGTKTWQEHARQWLNVEDEFIKSVYALCRKCGRTELQSLGFILRGLGCESAEERLQEVFE
jgi:hypothetical protein